MTILLIIVLVLLFGGGGGYYPYYADPYPYVVVQEPVNKYVIIDPNGKPIAVVTDVGKLPPGFTFRQATPAEAATNSPMSGFAGFGQATPYPVMVGKYRPLPGEGMRGLSTTFVTLPDDADIGDFAGGEESLF